MKDTRLLASLLMLTVLLAACSREGPYLDLRHNPTGKGTKVATFAGDSITAEELEQRFMEMSPQVRTRYQTLEQRKEYVEGLARFELLAAEAVRRGLHQDPDVLDAAKKVMVQKLLLAETQTPGASPSGAPKSGHDHLHERRSRGHEEQLIETLKRQADYRLNEEALAGLQVDLQAPGRPSRGSSPGFFPPRATDRAP